MSYKMVGLSAVSAVVNGGLGYVATAALTAMNPVVGLAAGMTLGVINGRSVTILISGKELKKNKLTLVKNVANVALATLGAMGAAKLTSLALGVPLGFKAALVLGGVAFGSGLTCLALVAVGVKAFQMLTKQNKSTASNL